MTPDDAMERLRRNRDEFRRLGVEHLYLFGSTARGKAQDGASDVDLFFDHARGAIGLFEVMDVRERATSILGHPADVTTRASLHPLLKAEIEASALLVF